jgi:hypothetical protein
MNLKKFLKPDWRKILIFLVMVFLTFLTGKVEPIYESTKFELGYPTFLIKWTHRMPPSTSYEWNFVNLFINAIIWYFLSCLIIWIYDKLKKKS